MRNFACSRCWDNHSISIRRKVVVMKSSKLAIILSATLSSLFFPGLIPGLIPGSIPGSMVQAQDELMKKPFTQWSKNEANKILNDSNWAITQEARIDFGTTVRNIAGAPTDESGHLSAQMNGANIPVDYRVTLRLRSALPIRQALVRLKQIEAKYDSMNEREHAAFHAKTKGLLDRPACAQNYVVTITCKSTNYPGADALYEGLRGATLP